jgi:hypothetical protein
MLKHFNAAEEIDNLGSYLEFGHKNIVDFKQRLATELEENIEKIRQSEFFDSAMSNDEIMRQAEMMDYDDIRYSKEEDKVFLGKLFLNVWHSLYGKVFSEKYDEMFYASVIIMLYSRIEIGLVKLCNIKRIKNDSGKCILDEAYSYLIGTLECKIEETDWKEIENIRWIRNTIIHSGLSFPFDEFIDDEVVLNSYGNNALVEIPPKLLKYLKSNKIYSKEYGTISINLEYCRHAIEFSSNFFQSIFRAHRRKLKES